LILGHETTIESVENSLSVFMRENQANTSPVMLCWDSEDDDQDSSLLGFMRRVSRSRPFRSGVVATSSSGRTECDLWVLGEAQNHMVEEFLEGIHLLYIADGHHRTQAAERVWEGRGCPGDSGPSSCFLWALFASSETQVVGWHWVIRGVEPFVDGLPDFEVAKVSEDEAVPASGTIIALYRGQWYRLWYVGPG
jgi:uncharacterized protein (DUF1015 family)